VRNYESRERLLKIG